MRVIPVRLWALAILSGALQVLPFPIAGPVPVWRTAFCWVALAPLLMALTGKNINGTPLSVGQGAALGYTSGVVWYLGNFYWIYQTLYLYGAIAKPLAAGLLLLFCLYMGLYHALFGALIAKFRRSRLSVQGALLLSPFVWVAVELARSQIAGLSWDLLGISQVDNFLLTRLAPFTGAYGLSFVIVAVNALWLLQITMKPRRYTRPVLMLAMATAILLYFVFLRRTQPPTHEATEATATLVQENLEVGALAASVGPPLTRTEQLQSFSKLSLFPAAESCDGIPELPTTRCLSSEVNKQGENAEAARYLQPSDLIVWPEAPNDFNLIDPRLRAVNPDLEFRAAISRLARTANAPMIVGSTGIDADPAVKRGYDQYNSAVFIQPDGSFAGRYDKMHLVPFGEYTPYKQWLFFAGSLLQDVGIFDSGKRRTVFTTGGHTYGTFICYESSFGNEVRQFAGLGAEALVNISDDGWYGDTSAAWEHLNNVRMRAIENHRWVLRATNTGVTAAIDPYGRITAAAPRHERTSLRVGFNYEHDVTFYSAHGDLFAYLCVLIAVVGLGASFSRRSSFSNFAEGRLQDAVNKYGEN
jgi:apolipoprotein N-acyltransferase